MVEGGNGEPRGTKTLNPEDRPIYVGTLNVGDREDLLARINDMLD